MAATAIVARAFKPATNIRPNSGGQAVKVNIDFSGGSSLTLDLFQQMAGGLLDCVQSIYIDNSGNPNDAFTIRFEGSSQRIVVPAGGLGTFPVFDVGKMKFTATSAGLGSVECIFMNQPVQYAQFGPISVNVANVTATFIPTAGTWVDHSGNAGASAQVFAANANAMRRLIQNPSGNINSIFINFGGVAAAATTLEIPPGESFDTETGPIDQTQWMIFAPVATDFIAKEMV